MEASLVRKSKTKYYNLAIQDEAFEYSSELGKIYSNNHKYTIVSNDILEDQFGAPYVLLHYYDTISLEEKNKKKNINFTCLIYQIPGDLKLWDDLISRHIDETDKLKVIFIGDYCIKDKMNPLLFKLVLFIDPTKEDISIDENSLKNVSPLQGAKKK